MSRIPHRLACGALTHPRTTLCAWLCGLLACGLVLVLTPGSITSIGNSVAGSQASRSVELARRYIPSAPGTAVTAVLTNDRPSVLGSQQISESNAALAPLERLPSVRNVEHAESATEEVNSGSVKSVTVYFVHVGLPYAATERRTPAIEAAIKRGASRYMSFGLFGETAIAYQYAKIIEKDLRSAELIALPTTACVLLIAFLSVVAALMPVLVSMVSLIYVLAIVHLLSLVSGQNVFILSTAPAIVLGLSIDYSLILITRVREERGRGCDTDDAIACAISAAGRAIALSGLTIAMTLPALAIIGLGLFTSIAIGGIIASLVAVSAACTLLPAAVSLLGERLEFLSIKPAVSAASRGTFWRRLAAAVTTHPRLAVLASAFVLLALATQAVPLRFAYGGAATLPAQSADSREVTDLTTAFGAGAAGLVKVVSDDPSAQSVLSENPDVRAVWRIISGIGKWKEYNAALNTAPESQESHQTVAQLRRDFAVPAVRWAVHPPVKWISRPAWGEGCRSC